MQTNTWWYKYFCYICLVLDDPVLRQLKSFFLYLVQTDSFSQTKHHTFIYLDHSVSSVQLLNCFFSPLSFRVSVKTFPIWLTHSTRYHCRWPPHVSPVGFVVSPSQWLSSTFSSVFFVLGLCHSHLLHCCLVSACSHAPLSDSSFTYAIIY